MTVPTWSVASATTPRSSSTEQFAVVLCQSENGGTLALPAIGSQNNHLFFNGFQRRRCSRVRATHTRPIERRRFRCIPPDAVLAAFSIRMNRITDDSRPRP
jgi:hypothetical protein